MRNKKVKQIRKNIINHSEEILISIRNSVGSRTEKMEQRQIYQTAKRLYTRGKLKLQK